MKSFVSGSALLLLACSAAGLAEQSPPRLILQITVDQLRGDLPDRYMKNMGEGGFRYLKEQGVWYANAHHGYTNTETAVGHTTLATGADPAVHGIVANAWFDRGSGKPVYSIEDGRYAILGTEARGDAAGKVDTTQKKMFVGGRSPASILVSTFSDELALYSNSKAKVFGVSVKDRGAVPLAGHAGKAFWFSRPSGEFVTSSYYYDQYPRWVSAWNRQKGVRAYDGKSWKLLHDRSTYLFGNDDDKPWEVDAEGFGRVFPHRYGPADGRYFNKVVTFSPAGDELTLDFAIQIIDAEMLGQDEVTDFLAISFSTTDYVGHLFGPSSLEAEDNMLRLDRTLANLFAYVDKRIGLENTLIVLSADHGGSEAGGYLKLFGIESGYVSLDIRHKEFIRFFSPPYLYLDREAIREKGLDQGEVEQAVADELMHIEGVALAISSSALRENRLPDTPLIRSALRNFNPERSGDILILFQPHYAINNGKGALMAANHGSPWNYDTFVPVIFAGNGLKPRTVYRHIDAADVAPTLAAWIGTRPPSGAVGRVLDEVLNQR